MESLRTVVRQGVPVTSVGRTIIDLAAVVSQTKLNRTIDAVLRDRLLRPSDLHKVLMSHARRGRNGSANLRAALCDYLGDDPVPLSEWSRMVEALLIAHGLDRPRLEYRIHAPDNSCPARADQAGGPVVDEAWSSVVEDRRRRNRLLLAGWNVLNFTWDDYVNRPADLCAQVKAACTHRPSG